MATDLGKRAKEAFVDDNFDLALDLYTQALDLESGNADILADRAQANLKLGNFTGTLVLCRSPNSLLGFPGFRLAKS